jgi:hypothetical protein
MAAANAFRYWFIGLYCLGFIAFLRLIILYRPSRNKIEKKKGPLPSPGILIPLGIPLLILLTRFAEMDVTLWMLRNQITSSLPRGRTGSCVTLCIRP